MAFKKNNYDDSKVREFGIKFTKDAFNLLFESHPNCKAIDLIDPNDYSFGVELERGGWLGNFWENDYSFVSGMAIRTINVPIRKLKYWYNTVYNKRVPNNDKLYKKKLTKQNYSSYNDERLLSFISLPLRPKPSNDDVILSKSSFNFLFSSVNLLTSSVLMTSTILSTVISFITSLVII